MNSAYTQDLIHQRDRAAADRKAAEDELGKLRRHIAQLTEELKTAREALHLWVELGTKAIAEHRYAHAAWQSTIVEARRQAARAEQAETRIAAAYRFADEMDTYCSPHGVASLYAERLRAALDGATTTEAQP